MVAYCYIIRSWSAKRRRLTNAYLILAHRLRRWANIKLELVDRMAFVG